MIHLNHAGTSWPKPRVVLQGVQEALQSSSQEAGALLEEATSKVCQALGIEVRERFLFTPGGTAALALAVADLPYNAGDAVLTSALEHHALARPIAKLVRERAVVHDVIPMAGANPVDLDFAERRLARGDVKLLAFTAASNVTGARLPVRELAELGHRFGALCLVDAAQTVGLDDTQLPELGADIVAFTGHKAAHGPHGIGGLWAAPQVTFESPWAVCEVGRARDACSPFPTYCDVGSVNLAGAVGLARGLSWALERHREMQQAVGLAEILAREIEQRSGVELVGSVSGPRIPTVSIRLCNVALGRAQPHFAERGLAVRAGQHCAPMALQALGAPEGTLRVSFGATNREEHLVAFLEALDALR